MTSDTLPDMRPFIIEVDERTLIASIRFNKSVSAADRACYIVAFEQLMRAKIIRVEQ